MASTGHRVGGQALPCLALSCTVHSPSNRLPPSTRVLYPVPLELILVFAWIGYNDMIQNPFLLSPSSFDPQRLASYSSIPCSLKA